MNCVLVRGGPVAAQRIPWPTLKSRLSRSLPLLTLSKSLSSQPRLSRHFSSTATTPASTNGGTDVVVVGGGIAGLCASIAAAENGASVLLIDRAHGGGASALSGGVIYAGGGTRQQKEAGIDWDTPEAMYNYLRIETGGTVREATLRRFCEESASRNAWLESHGVRFNSSLCPYKTSVTTDEHYLFYSGSETAHPFVDAARPAPRGHRVHHPGFSGAGLMQSLFEGARRLGVRFRPAAKAQQVVRNDSSGAVVGLEHRSIPMGSPAFTKHQAYCARASKYQLMVPGLAESAQRRADALWEEHARPVTTSAHAVVLAAGGFAFNPEMREKYLPKWSGVGRLGTYGDDGSGIKLGQAAGGATSCLDRMSAWRFIYPPESLVEGIIVAQNGQRFSAEDVYGARMSEKMALEHDGKAFLVLNAATWAKAKQELWTQVPMPVKIQRAVWMYWAHKKANTIEELAIKLGVDPGGLRTTADAHDLAIANNEPDPMQKAAAYRSALSEGPFYGIDISLTADGLHLTPGFTLGGLCVDEDSGLVVDEQEKPIPGLYAAGRNAIGLCSNGYISGLSLADGAFSGKRAGEHAAAQIARGT